MPDTAAAVVSAPSWQVASTSSDCTGVPAGTVRVVCQFPPSGPRCSTVEASVEVASSNATVTETSTPGGHGSRLWIVIAVPGGPDGGVMLIVNGDGDDWDAKSNVTPSVITVSNGLTTVTTGVAIVKLVAPASPPAGTEIAHSPTGVKLGLCVPVPMKVSCCVAAPHATSIVNVGDGGTAPVAETATCRMRAGVSSSSPAAWVPTSPSSPAAGTTNARARPSTRTTGTATSTRRRMVLFSSAGEGGLGSDRSGGGGRRRRAARGGADRWGRGSAARWHLGRRHVERLDVVDARHRR